jgi:hypothetical protein
VVSPTKYCMSFIAVFKNKQPCRFKFGKEIAKASIRLLVSITP